MEQKYSYGNTSQQRLESCDPRLQLVMRGALATGLIDITIIEGVRSKEKQNEFFKTKKSKVQWPNGKHNIVRVTAKSEAIDVGPYINDKLSFDYRHCCYLAGIIISVGLSLGIKLRWGGNWDMDGEPITDQDFQDLVHFELID